MKALINAWYRWFKKQPWSLKWFLWLILLMPFIATFYDLKGEGRLSPLQIAGALSFFVFLKYIIQVRVRLKPYERLLVIFGFLLVANHAYFLIDNFSIGNLGYVLRNLHPLLLYFYLRRVIRSREELEGVLMTFVVASIFPYSILIYEIIFDPIKEVYIQESRGGFTRLNGFYADIFSYIAYVIGNFVILIYFSLKSKLKLSLLGAGAVLFITLLGIQGLSHQASWGVFLAIVLSILLVSRNTRLAKQFSIIVGIGFLLGGGFFLNKFIVPLFSKEIGAYTGESNKEKALNGRIVRWQHYFEIWEEMPAYSKVFGVGLSGSKYTRSMMSGGMHSDYVRFMFATGIFGIICYLLFYASLMRALNGFRKPEKYLFFSTIVIMMLYGLTANPFGSSGALIYLTLSAFAFCALDKKTIYGKY